jgi:radical SAM superfamily enzyme YgiQ (UPF0313 family)
MPKKVISFVSPNFQQGPTELNAYYLPYSPGVIWSYAHQFSEIHENYELGEFIWRRDDLQEAYDTLKDSDVVGFSSYIWNRSYTKELGKLLRKNKPDLFIVGGGPEFPIEKEDIFEQYPFLDICVKLEGEKTFRRILEEHLKPNPDYKSIKGILINENGKAFNTGESERIDDLDTIPSPYLTGVFDKLMAKHPEIRWNGTIETNRGCPYACTFCDWGSLTYNKIKIFDLQRVFDELEWMGKNQFDFISFTDANFGIFAERDSLIADKLIEVQKKYGNPRAYTIAWAKNQKKEVVDIVKKLIYEGGSKMGLNLSVQTMDENTLEVIRRKNLDTNKIEEVFEMCEEANIPLYTELILGLPGETLSSWKENFYRLYKAGNHTGITVYQAQLLENAEMNLKQRKMYKMQGQMVYDYLVGSRNTNELREGVEVVVSTRDLTPEKMLEAQLHSWFQNTFHINGMTNYISRILYKAHNVEYRDFYEKFYNFVEKDPWVKSEIDRIAKHYGLWGEKGMIDHDLIQGMQIHGWNLIHSTIIMLQSENKHKHIFDLIEDFMLKEYPLDKSLHDDLMKLQRNYLIDYTQSATYPKVIDFNHDIFGYLQDQGELNQPASYEFDFPEDKHMSLEKFCEQIFFARRRNFGKAWVTRVK